MKPLVAIVGRPNVGKSMLFNKLCGQRLSIVEDTPGVTRDRLYAQCEWRNRVFDIVDTGGIEPSTDNEILAFMREQAEIAIQTATVNPSWVRNCSLLRATRCGSSPTCKAILLLSKGASLQPPKRVVITDLTFAGSGQSG